MTADIDQLTREALAERILRERFPGEEPTEDDISLAAFIIRRTREEDAKVAK